MLPPEPGSDLVRQALRINLYCLVFVNGELVSGQAFEAVDGIYVPLAPVAEALRLPLGWDPVRKATIFAGKWVPATVIDGVSYLRTVELDSVLAEWADLNLTEKGVFIEGLGSLEDGRDEPSGEG